MTVEDWCHIDLDDALAVLEGWVGSGVVVALDTPEGPPDLAGMSGVLRLAERSAGPDGGRAFELEGSDAWFRVPHAPWFRGASYAADARVLVLELAGRDGSSLLVDVHAR